MNQRDQGAALTVLPGLGVGLTAVKAGEAALVKLSSVLSPLARTKTAP